MADFASSIIFASSLANKSRALTHYRLRSYFIPFCFLSLCLNIDPSTARRIGRENIRQIQECDNRNSYWKTNPFGIMFDFLAFVSNCYSVHHLNNFSMCLCVSLRSHHPQFLYFFFLLAVNRCGWRNGYSIWDRMHGHVCTIV